MDKNNVFLLSFMMGMGKQYDDDITADDLKYWFDPNVTDCQIELYLNVIQMLASGSSYDEVLEYVDNFNNVEYEELLEDQKSFVKSRVKRDINKRKKILEGEDNNE